MIGTARKNSFKHITTLSFPFGASPEAQVSLPRAFSKPLFRNSGNLVVSRLQFIDLFLLDFLTEV